MRSAAEREADCAAEHCVVRRLSLAVAVGTTIVCLSAAKKGSALLQPRIR